MSEGQETRAERIARYKEERRRQLAVQFDVHSDPSKKKNKDSSSSEGPRTTKASRLRAAVSSQENGPNLTQTTDATERLPVTTEEQPGAKRVERDKSSKRKSNLNRALNSEEVPNCDSSDDVKARRRRRRFFPSEVLNQPIKETSSNDEKVKSDTNLPAPNLSQSSSSRVVSPKTVSRRSTLSIHMENARKGIAPSYSEMGKFKPLTKRTATSSPKSSKSSTSDNSHSDKDTSKDLTRRKPSYVDRSVVAKNKSNSDNDVVRLTRNTAKRMEELTALTKETLARVEKLATKVKEAPKAIKKQPLSSSPVKQMSDSKKNLPFSILKKKSIEEPTVEIVPNAAPVSILKRKVSQEDHVRSEGTSSTHTPPVTFSPSVVEPATTNRKQGILKKRRSLDESQVMRHRSCSPDVANKTTDSRSILKNQRRSSLEELRRIQSPEAQLHSILKRKTSRNEEDDHSLNSPQGILKRRSGASSAGSTGSTPHVSITTAVILAAAGGAEMILEPDAVKPILKKKSFSEEHSYYSESNHSETPRPILKKKSSTETDDCDDRPKKPILKLSRNSIDKESDSGEGRSFSNLKYAASENECDVKPILRQNSEGTAPKPRLSFCNERSSGDDDEVRRSRRSNTICTDFNVNSRLEPKEEDRDLRKPRPLSVFDLVMSFESSTSTGAIPKKSSMKRNNDRYKTQPITSNELEASLNLVRIPQLPKVRSPDSTFLLNFTSSLENDSDLNGFLSSSFHNTSPDSGVCGKMSSDSAFQSLGDGLELDQEDATPEVSIKPHKLEPSKLEMQMKAIAEEAKNKKLGKGNAGFQKYRNRRSTAVESSRFSTQPVTFDEVQEAARINKNSEDSGDEADPSNLSLFERIKLFNVKVDENRAPKRDVPRRRINRFQTQPVTTDEVNTARCIPPTQALDDDSERFCSERRGILKLNSSASRRSGDSSPSLPKSALKKRDSFTRFSSKTEIPDITYDEGISCNDSGSDSEIASVSFTPKNVDDKTATRSENRRFGKSNSDTTSDGESSGGREVRSIFKNDNKLKVKQALESVLSKSRSQGVVGDEIQSPNRNTTSILRRSQTHSAMPRTIAELQAKLQQNGESGWKKRAQQNHISNDEITFLKDKNKYNDELSEKSILALKKDELDAAAKQWKSRVEKSDAEKFSVAGRMDKSSALPINILPVDKNKRTPQAKRFKGREGSDSSSTPVSPDKSRHLELTRSYSVPDPDQTQSGAVTTQKPSGRTVLVSRPDDFTFKNFYKSIEETNITNQRFDVSLDDFDAVTRHSLLVQKKNIQVQRRRGASKNPIKALASRTDITDEYTEVITGVAEREKKRLNIEKLAKHSNLALEALAGLASKEDFTAVALKKSSSVSALVPFKDVMLLQVKGRRHVQTRLVEPKVSSINEGDNFILVTGNCLYNYIGAFANVIEQSRALDVVNHIQQTGDLGCKVDEVITISAKNSSSPAKQIQNFWKLLGSSSTIFTEAGNPTEDEIYESNILSTNMIYKLEDDELVPWDEYWGVIPKIEMLQSTRVIVFDFGSEMYVWSGKIAPLDKKKRALKLAKELWDEGYNYSECSICPLNVASILGDRPAEKVEVKSSNRPNWALFAKITQHRETILFKEKFLDWPDFSRVIRIKGDETDKNVDPSYDIQPCNVEEMLKQNNSEPDLVVEGHHLGRGASYFDEETKRLFEFDTVDITAWRILENHSEKLCDSSVSHFYDGDSYIIRWNYRMTVKGRELSGKPSKYAQAGRNRCIYFCWQGSNASINEKGYAALLTVELDNEKAPQIRVVQGSEPAAFLRLFEGSMVVHKGKRDDPENAGKPRLFMIKGEMENEVSLIEVPCELKQLRSRTCLILVDSDEMFIWYGAKSSKQTKKVAKRVANQIVQRNPIEFSLDDDIEVTEVHEGEETREFFDIIGNEANSYFSLLDKNFDYDFNIRLFNLSSVSGSFKATEIICPYRSEHSSPYPFLQSELYSASQPALFLIDNHHELWLWQGWWPETEENVELSDQTGSGAVRWQVERKVAMQTAVDYWKKSHSGDETVPAYLVWAGLEPLEFKNLFPNWVEREDVAELNLLEGRKRDAKLLVEEQLTLLSRTTYPLAELLQRPLPEGVDPTHLEIYLSPEDFHDLLAMTKEEFQKLPMWKQTAMKKEKGLF